MTLNTMDERDANVIRGSVISRAIEAMVLNGSVVSRGKSEDVIGSGLPVLLVLWTLRDSFGSRLLHDAMSSGPSG